MEKLGLSYESLRQLNKKLIYCSISGYGQSGEKSQLSGHDINYMADNGLLDQCGGIIPTPGNLQFSDTAGRSLHAVIGVQAALLQKAQSGEGQYIDISMRDCSLPLGAVAFSSLGEKDKPRRNDEVLSGGFPFYDVYKTKDGRYMALGALEKKFWVSFCDTIGKKDWASWHDDPDNFAKYKAQLSGLFMEETQQNWVTIVKGFDCCCSPVHHLSEASGINKRDTEEGSYYEVNFPIPLSGVVTKRKAAPKLGEHNDEVLD